jgi:putative membrane protein
LLEEHNTLLYCFFFGLVFASIPFVGREIKSRNLQAALAFIIGTAVAFGISSLPVAQNEPSSLFLFGAGALAACAMILPGISGSFVLLLLGAYATVIGAVKSFDLVRIVIIASGVITGLLLFSKLLKWTLERHYNVLIALLTGFLFGSLRAIWPWKEKVELLYTHSDGRETWSEALSWPGDLPLPVLASATVCAILGVGIVLLMNRFDWACSADPCPTPTRLRCSPKNSNEKDGSRRDIPSSNWMTLLNLKNGSKPSKTSTVHWPD